MSELARQVVAFVQSHHGWAGPIMFAFASREPYAFISVFLPTASVLIGFGMLIAGGFALWPAWLAAALGAFGAHWLAYALAFRFKTQITRAGRF